MNSNPMSLVIRFYAGITKLGNSIVCECLQQIGAKPPQHDTIVFNIYDTLSETHDSRRLFLTFLHCLYEADRNDLLPCLTESSTDISFIFYRLSMYDINVISHSLVDMARLCYPYEFSLFISACDLDDHKIESAVDIIINRARLNYQKYHQCVSFDIPLVANNLTHNGVKSLVRLINAEGIIVKSLDLAVNFLNHRSSLFEVLKILHSTIFG